MIKNLLRPKAFVLYVVFIFAAQTLNAQNYLIQENFDNFPANLNGVSSNGWTANSISGDTAVDRWQFNNSIGYDIPSPLSGKVALADAYMGGYQGTGSNNSNTQDLALVSPSVNTTGLNNLTLTWDHLYMQLSASTIYVEVSTNGGTNWTSIYSTATGNFFSASNSLNLSSYTGFSNVKIRFRWTKPASQTHGYWMLDNVKLFSRFANDVGVESLISPKNNSCPDPTQSLSLRVTNFGTSSASNINVNMGVAGGTSGNFSTSIGTLAAGASTNVFTGNTINTTAGGNFNFTAYTTYAGDQTSKNDTLYKTIVTAPKPTDPSGNSIVRCGVGPVTLVASALAGEETVWYNDSTTSTALGTGNPFNNSNTVYASRKFFAENTRNLASIHGTGLTGVYRYNTTSEKAIFFDLTAINEIVIDSFASNFAYNGRYICSIYYRSGSYTGNVTNAGAFTLLRIDTVNAISLGQPTYIRLGSSKLRVGQGQTYGFAITSRVLATSGGIPAYAFKLGITNNISNADIVVYAADVAETAFSNSLYGYSGDINVYYQKVCKSQRKSINVVIIPRPTGVKTIEGVINNGAYRSGTIGEPDVARLNDTLSYELTPPTGYTNADFGSSWVITDFSFKTASGTGPNTTDTSLTFPGTSNGTLRFIPSSGVDTVFIVKVTVLDIPKQCDTTITRYILVGADPRARFSTKAICEGDEMTFANLSTIASGSMSHKWYFGDGDSSNVPAPKHTYSSAGNYSVRLVSTSNYGFKSVFDSSIQVFEIPQANFAVANVCIGGTHQFNDASYIPSIGTPVYSWEFGDGSVSSNAANPAHTYTQAGVYIAKMSVNVNGCFDSKQKYVTLAPRAIVNFAAATSCNNREVNFSNATTIDFGTFGSMWKFGDGSSANGPNPKHGYNTFGNMDVTLVITSDLGCKDSLIKTITLIESPKADFSLSSTCSGESVQINNLTTVPSGGSNGYQWRLGNGQMSVSDNPKTTYPGPGTYLISLTAFNTNGCVDSISRTITIDTKPIANFVASDVCDGSPVIFNNNTVNTTGNISYVWNFGDGRMSMVKDTSLLYSGFGSYDVQLFAITGNGCTDTIKRTVLVNELPSAVFTVNSAMTGDGQMYFQGPAGISYTYQWFLGDGGKSTIKDFLYTYSIAGTYQVELVVSSGKGCKSSSKQSISVNPSGLFSHDEMLRMYPNPGSGTLHIDLSALPVQTLVMVVRDIQGKELTRADVLGGEIHLLDLSSFPSGTYLVELSGGTRNYSGKVILIH